MIEFGGAKPPLRVESTGNPVLFARFLGVPVLDFLRRTTKLPFTVATLAKSAADSRVRNRHIGASQRLTYIKAARRARGFKGLREQTNPGT
ncbi:MAG: hypothetical protein R3E44_10325 [Paracoccaceae bacterium]